MTLEALQRADDFVFYSVLRIARAIGTQAISEDISLNVITPCMHAVIGDEELNPLRQP